MKWKVLDVMAFVAYVAVGLAAVRSNDEHLALAVLVLTVSALGSASLLAIRRRGVWAGFAVFGWAWFLTCQPNDPVAFSRSLTVAVASEVFSGERNKWWSMSSALSLSSVAFGFLGALVGWSIDHRAEAGEGGRRRPADEDSPLA